MGAACTSGQKKVAVIDCSIDVELAEALQQSEVEAVSRDLLLAREQYQTDQNAGLTQEQMAMLPMSHYMDYGSSNKECKICSSNYIIGDLLRTLPCCHLFHSNCVDSWITMNNTCPTCRRQIKEDMGITPAPTATVPTAPPIYMM